MSEFYLDSGKSGGNDACEFCVAAHKAWIRHDVVAKYHCYLCNVCSVKDLDVEHIDQRDIISEMDVGLNACSKTYENLGNFVWLCSQCLSNMKTMNVAETVETLSKPAWLGELTALFENKLQEIDHKVNSNIDILAADLSSFKEEVGNQLRPQMAIDDCSSPLRKRRIVTASIPKPISVPPRKAGSTTHVTPPYTPPVSVSPMTYKAALKLDCGDAAALKEISSLKAQKELHVPEFDCKASKEGSAINVLFKSYKDALDTKRIFEEKLNKMNVPSPVRRNMKKLDLVGLPYDITKEEAMLAFLHDNSSLGLSVSSDNPCAAGMKNCPEMYIRVLDVKKCKKKNLFRVLFHATESLIDTMEGLQIKLMSCVMEKFVLPDSIQCYNCSRFGHFADKCKFQSVCAKCASTDHKTTECTSLTYKCINCVRNNLTDTDHPAYSHKCPCFT